MPEGTGVLVISRIYYHKVHGLPESSTQEPGDEKKENLGLERGLLTSYAIWGMRSQFCVKKCSKNSTIFV